MQGHISLWHIIVPYSTQFPEVGERSNEWSRNVCQAVAITLVEKAQEYGGRHPEVCFPHQQAQQSRGWQHLDEVHMSVEECLILESAQMVLVKS